MLSRDSKRRADGGRPGDRHRPDPGDALVYERDERRPTTEHVVEAVAARAGADPLSLPPLQGVLDADALNELFRAVPGRGPTTAAVEVRFAYAGYEVTVDARRVVVEGA